MGNATGHPPDPNHACMHRWPEAAGSCALGAVVVAHARASALQWLHLTKGLACACEPDSPVLGLLLSHTPVLNGMHGAYVAIQLH